MAPGRLPGRLLRHLHSFIARGTRGVRPLPVVVLEPGLGFSAPQYQSLAEEIASHGYIVLGVTPTYSANLSVLAGSVLRSTPAGNPEDIGGHSGQAVDRADRLVDLWAIDARFAAATLAEPRGGSLADHVEPRSVTYIGHSFGGAAALLACHEDAHCAGAVDIDGTQFGPVVTTGLLVPMLILGSGDSCITGTCGPAAADNPDDRRVADSLRKASTGLVGCFILDGAQHFNFTDYGAMYIAAPLRQLLALGDIDGDRALTIQNTLVIAFLTQIHEGGNQPILDNALDPLPRNASHLLTAMCPNER